MEADSGQEWSAERPDQHQMAGRGEDSLLERLWRALAPRPRDVWVMEPDGRMRKVMMNDE